MKRKGESVIQLPYPTDRVGEPYHPYELGYTPDWDTDTLTNNHHLAFYARRFGATAIGLAYRNLDIMQVQLDIGEHVQLHRHYSGITPPPEVIMLDRIEEEKECQGLFKIWNFETKQYEYSPITDDKINTLKGHYGKHDA